MKPLKILVTAGPTREPIDPVRFISNYSTGYMGYAIAEAARKRNHRVTLITGPAPFLPPKKIKTIPVITAHEMIKAVKRCAKGADCIIMAAAVSDFRPAKYSTGKIKRTGGIKNIRLKKNPDILHWLGRRKGKKILVGFCMETKNLAANAEKKLADKNLDIIVANRIDAERSIFGGGRTAVYIIGLEKETLADATKEAIAAILLDKVEKLWYKRVLKIKAAYPSG